MSNILMYSNILLWVFIILQTIVIFLLTKSITHFLNRFKLEKANSRIVSVGTRAPLFREVSEDGQLVKLSDYNNKNTILFFAKDTCNVCKATLAALIKVIQNTTSMRLIIVAPEEVEEKNITYPNNDYTYLVRSNSILINYEVYDVPTIFLIDPNGIISNVYSNDKLDELKKDLGINS
ncbi:peroxiredoxin family protein [Lysinibacillus sp. NPDC093190]|uniref:peroxiredoxin family protein n=1 Tax=Lysinibacillus sp. NPDC093190 TaxID=3390575 RepID=UPI003D07614C